MKRRTLVTTVTLIAWTSLVVLFCQIPLVASQEVPPPKESTTAAEPEITLLAIPEPPLEHLEKAVSDQIREAQSLILAATRNPEATYQHRARAYIELGQVFHAYELNDSAEACYRNALILDPPRMEWNYNLGYLLMSMGRYDEAVECFQKAMATQPESYLIFMRLGECYRNLNRPDLAKQAYEAASRVNPDGPALLARLGEIALEEKRYEDAVRLLEAALEGQPGANKLHYPLAMAYRGLNDMEKARFHLSQKGMVGIQPPDPLRKQLDVLLTGLRVHMLSGKLAFSAGRFVEAAEEFLKAVEAEPENAAARINLGTSLGKLGRYEDAIAQFKEAVRLEPENITVQFNLGSLLAHVGENKAAIEHLRITCEKQPEDAQAQLALADALRKEGSYGEALDHYKIAVKLDHRLISAWFAMSTMLSQAGQHRDALIVLEEAHQRLPNHGPVAHALARQLASSPDLSLRDGKRAAELAERVYRAQPHWEHAKTVAMAYAEAGQCIKAVEWQERAVNLAAAMGESDQVLGLLNRNLLHFKNQRPCRVPGGN